MNLEAAYNFGEPLKVTLVETSLNRNVNDIPKYETLSYVWGLRTGTCPILCHGKSLLVTPNCISALRHLRHKEEVRVLWVDAICIDQGHSGESVNEGNTQVSLMGEVYAKANRTICWFGAGVDFSDGVMQHLRGIGNCPSQRGLKKFLQYDGT
jgi:hypothetical protein